AEQVPRVQRLGERMRVGRPSPVEPIGDPQRLRHASDRPPGPVGALPADPDVGPADGVQVLDEPGQDRVDRLCGRPGELGDLVELDGEPQEVRRQRAPVGGAGDAEAVHVRARRRSGTPRGRNDGEPDHAQQGRQPAHEPGRRDGHPGQHRQASRPFVEQCAPMARPQATPRALAVARGDEPADTLITGGRVFADATREWVDTSLALADGVIAGWGEREAAEVIDVGGAALTPGFVDAHMHLESTKLWIDEFVATVLPTGTTAVAADPHEIANVLGVPGILALMAAAAPLPFTFAVYASSCVPASPFESAGATLDATDIGELIARHGAHGVAEVMNFPGVIGGDEEMLARVAVAAGLRVDGHSPGVSGPRLDAYLAAGVESDHESTLLAEAEEKRRKGMWVFLRQGSASQNLVELAPSIVAHGTDQAAFCTDDREPDTLRALGHVNDCARLAVASGISEVEAILLASTNPARYHGFDALGSLGPGHQADILA